jgi:hypothetical protein
MGDRGGTALACLPTHRTDPRSIRAIEEARMTRHVVPAAIGALALFGGVAHAQEPSRFRNAISFTVGVASGSGGGRDFRHGFDGGDGLVGGSTGGVLGGTLLRDLSDRVAFEASGAYLDRGASHGASAMGQILFTLFAGGKTVPYLSAGGGIHHTSADFVTVPERIPPDVPRGARGYDDDGRPRPGVPAPVAARRSSTDPALSLGGGLRLDLGPRFYARPDARLMMVMGDGRNETFGVFTMNVGWRF